MRCHSTAFLQRTCGKPVFSVHDGCQLAAADVFVCRFPNFFAFFLTLGAPILTPSVSWMCETSWLEWLNESSSTSCGETGSLCDRMNSVWSWVGKSFWVGWVCPAISARISEKCSPIVFSRASILPSKLSMRCFSSVRRDRTSLISGSSRTTFWRLAILAKSRSESVCHTTQTEENTRQQNQNQKTRRANKDEHVPQYTNS